MLVLEGRWLASQLRGLKNIHFYDFVFVLKEKSKGVEEKYSKILSTSFSAVEQRQKRCQTLAANVQFQNEGCHFV